jgi:hypothetical protein
VTKARPDGYTLLFGSASQFGVAPLIQEINYDPDALVPFSLHQRTVARTRMLSLSNAGFQN